MSTEIHLIGIQELEASPGGSRVPAVVEEVEGLGFGGLYKTLIDYSKDNPDVLVRPEWSDHQFLVADPDTLIQHFASNPGYWDESSFGWGQAMEALQEDLEDGHRITWWIIVD